MHVYLVARHMDLTDAIRSYVEQHLIDPIRNHTGLNITRLETQLFPEGDKANQFGCHVLVEIKGHAPINVRELQDTEYAAIDVAKDRVIRSLVDTRDKMLTERRHPKKYSFARLGRALGWVRRNRVREA
ncbi:MAG: Sigma 54 modulation protein / ribosomal protein [Myxococcales bacterium]|nr:Sigma 54 modulation protein / ribosomal protein [Myxococcales bacterium]